MAVVPAAVSLAVPAVATVLPLLLPSFQRCSCSQSPLAVAQGCGESRNDCSVFVLTVDALVTCGHHVWRLGRFLACMTFIRLHDEFWGINLKY
jgi:hypothetical protein